MAWERSRGEEPNVSRAGWRAHLDGLTPAQARALSRSAPLTPAEFKAIGRIAEQRIDALRVVLDGDADPPRPAK